MIEKLTNIPANMVGFRATGEVTAEDFKSVVVPAVDELVARTKELNYLMIIDTALDHFTAGAWFQDALVGIKKIARWKRAAILSDSNGVIKFTNIFSVVVPGEFKGFRKEDLEAAIAWVSGE